MGTPQAVHAGGKSSGVHRWLVVELVESSLELAESSSMLVTGVMLVTEV